MADFGVEYVGDSPGDIQSRLAQTSTTGRRRVNEALREAAEEVKEDLEDTSPVDTGDYQSGWYIFPVENEEVWILNDVEHAQFVMLPNAKMVGSNEADLPASGVLHNVKGVAKSNSDDYRQGLIEKLEEMIDDLSIS